MVRVWNISGDLGKRTTVIVNRVSLRPGESTMIPDALWAKLREPNLSDTAPPPPPPAPVRKPKPVPEPAPASQPEPEVKPVSYEGLTKKELVAAAEARGIDVKSSMKKAEIRALLEEE